MIDLWLAEDIQIADRSKMLKALLAGDVATFEAHFQRFVVQVFSFHDAVKPAPESFYHAFILGLIASLDDHFFIRSNRESGFGRYDIALIPRPGRQARGVIFEIKSPDEARNETLETALAEAEAQFLQKKYETELADLGVATVLRLAVAVQGKLAKVKNVG